MSTQIDTIWINAKLVTMKSDSSLGVVENGAIAQHQGQITLVSDMSSLDGQVVASAKEVIDVKGRCITPGLIDCHTHVVFGEHRAREHQMRLEGVPYTEISRRGGGIVSSVKSTRNTPERELYLSARKRLLNLRKDGVTTIEIKSGYGLNLEDERKMLRVARRLGEDLPITVKTTFLGAHALPEEFKHNRQAYINHLCDDVLPALKGENLVDAVDAFCEKIAFTDIEVEQVFQAAKKLGLDIKVHAEQLSNCGGSALAAHYSALSSDHLEFIDENGVKAMAKSGTVAVLLPGAFFMLRESQKPPVELFRKYQVPMAVATDCNPGTSPVLSLRLMLLMACQLFGLTPVESLRAVTIHAAMALGLDDTLGSIEVGKLADLVIWDIEDPAELSYWVGGNLVSSVIKSGELVTFD